MSVFLCLFLQNGTDSHLLQRNVASLSHQNAHTSPAKSSHFLPEGQPDLPLFSAAFSGSAGPDKDFLPRGPCGQAHRLSFPPGKFRLRQHFISASVGKTLCQGQPASGKEKGAVGSGRPLNPETGSQKTALYGSHEKFRLIVLPAAPAGVHLPEIAAGEMEGPIFQPGISLQPGKLADFPVASRPHLLLLFL